MADNYIRGTVTLTGDPIQGATVKAVPHGEDTALYETTDSNGDYEFGEDALLSGTNDYHVVARYEDGGTLYRSLAKPWITAEGPTTTIVDSFEDGNLDEYTSHGISSSHWNVTTNRAYDGDRSLEESHNNVNGSLVSMPGDGLNYYPSRGDPVRVNLYSENFGNQWMTLTVLAQSHTENPDGYKVGLNGRTGEFELEKEGGSEIATTSVNWSSNQWYEAEIYPQDGGNITATLWDVSGSSPTEMASLSITDSEFDSGGIAIGQLDGDDTSDNKWTDYIRVEP